jgi:hypothetical protein
LRFEKNRIILCLFSLTRRTGDTPVNLLSNCFAIPHQLNKSLEVMRSIVWTRRRFGMILDRDYGQRRVPHSFDASVIQINVRDFHFRRQTVGLHGKAVIV